MSDSAEVAARPSTEAEQMQLLKQYAKLANTKVLTSQSDLNPKDKASSVMLTWCREQGDIVVMDNGDILSADPTSRDAQNAKVVMRNKGLTPGLIRPASESLIRMVLDNARASDDLEVDSHDSTVSAQQQRLRILVKEALYANASDIHMEIRKDIVRIRFRKNGELYLHAEWLPKIGREVASVAFNKETDQASTHFNPNVPQNASMPLDVEGRLVRLRLASLPAHGGFDVVMRLLTTEDNVVPDLEKLGYLPQDAALIRKAINMPHGAVIMAGPTGSGKTTTLASCMREVERHRKLYMIEDPVEKIIEKATQVPVNTDHYDRSFASMTRTALRMDPDIIVLGETRDEDTAAVMVRAAITGHLIFTTVHANTSPEIVTRLADLGVTRTLLASPNMLVCLICQRLAPKLCQECATPLAEAKNYQPYLKRWAEVFGDDMHKLKVRGQKNCLACNGTGISGRTVVAEVIWIDEESRKFIQDGDTLGWLHYLKEQGWHTYDDQLLQLVRDAVVDPLDAERMIGEISTTMGDKSFNYDAPHV